MNTPSSTPSFNFTRSSVNPADLKAHPLLEELGYSNESDAQFAEMMKYFDHYENPVIDIDNNAITHWAEVQAAVANCKPVLECYSVDMTINQLRQFILLKHKYNAKNLIASFKTVQFYEDYLANDEEGIKLSASLTGTTREKTALLMHTSDSTIGRLKNIGENKFEKLGLIDKGFTSFKHVQEEIKAERLAAATAARIATVSDVPVSATEYYVEPDVTAEGNDVPDANEEYHEPVELNESVEGNTPESIMPYYENGDESDNHGAEKSTQPLFEDFNCFFSTEGLGQFEINVSDNVPTVTINDKVLKNMSYTPVIDEKGSGTTHSFVISQPGKNGLCIQLTIENISKAA